MKKNYEVDVEWLPFELHPGIPPEGTQPPEYVRARMSETRVRLNQMASEAGMEMVFHETRYSSRRALEASEYAREQGKHEDFHQIVFRKYYGEGQNLYSWDVLRAAAEEAGLDADEMQRETDNGKYRSSVDMHVARAKQMGITGVPAYILNDKYAILGAQPYEVFEQAMTQVIAEMNHEASD